MTRHCVEWDEVAETVAPNGVAKRVLDLAGVTLVRITVPAGTAAGRHSHAHEQFVQVLSGAGVLETEQGEQPFGPGSIFQFPRDTWHAARFETETVLVETNLAPV